ncbi:protein Largen [Misgurnus anguillicaudatus]|uniref:protein Largen n=1 Tax=Misgurnus anguillicaudatus TaxID=75329 RepID=UPI002434C306|nr:protein Largen [Misgurnus anguillicaudatus]
MSGVTAVNKVQVKRQIRGIVKDLENILGDLKDVAKELKEVVHDIDCLTSDLHLEEETRDSSKTDTLNSSSSSMTTTSSMERIKVYPEETLLRPSSVSSAILTVLKRPNPPLPPPRTTLSRGEDHEDPSSGMRTTANGPLMRNGAFPAIASSRGSCHGPRNVGPPVAPMSRHAKNRCPQTTRERVRFSEKVQYHGYCPDCDLQCDVDETDLHLHTEVMDVKLSPSHHRCSPPAQILAENGNLAFSPLTARASQKPHKTILRKSTSTTV